MFDHSILICITKWFITLIISIICQCTIILHMSLMNIKIKHTNLIVFNVYEFNTGGSSLIQTQI